MSLKQLLPFVLTILLCLAGAQETQPFRVGEVLRYDASINFLRAGSAVLEVSSQESLQDAQVFHIIFSLTSNRFLDRLYRVRDQVETWIDVDGLFTRKYRKKLREKNYSKDFLAQMSYEDSVVVSGKKSFPLTQELRDPYSLFYYLRTLPLQVGDLLSFTTFDNNRFTDFQVTVHRTESVRVPAGRFDCIVIEPFRKGRALLKNQGDMIIWFSDDEKRLPVKVVSKAKFGSVILRLRSVGE